MAPVSLPCHMLMLDSSSKRNSSALTDSATWRNKQPTHASKSGRQHICCCIWNKFGNYSIFWKGKKHHTHCLDSTATGWEGRRSKNIILPKTFATSPKHFISKKHSGHQEFEIYGRHKWSCVPGSFQPTLLLNWPASHTASTYGTSPTDSAGTTETCLPIKLSIWTTK